MHNPRALLAGLSLLALAATCQQSPTLHDQPQPTPATSADKFLIPDPSWDCGMPQGIPVSEQGATVLQAKLDIDQVYDVGTTPFGKRQVIVLKGGTFSSDITEGTVMPGGLDFQLTLSNGTIEVEQILMLKSSDGRYILSRSAGVGTSSDVRIVSDFEAPTNSPAARLNTGKYVTRRSVDIASKSITLTVHDASSIPTADAAHTLRINKPTDAPPQPWDYRHAVQGERQGDTITTESVSLAPSQQVGPSKRGSRNIIPITGGTLSGLVSGKVLPGGADYQNLTTQPTIDARYLWQTDDGQIIIVRNTTGIGQLVPTFETSVTGKFDWLNTGKYLSSNPRLGGGGVSISMYKSN